MNELSSRWSAWQPAFAHGKTVFVSSELKSFGESRFAFGTYN